ncbi:GNAT family N-acetyltransferase [Synechocystis salina LEGE 06155]|nr:GNAT family N-acetyltransferase [Synechocystis salina LEGE 06155]
MTSPLQPPEKLTPLHHLQDFDSGSPVLDNWLKQKAITNDLQGASRTYVVCSDNKVVGFYCLANGAVARNAAPSRVKRNMPDPIPVMLLGRLAVDKQWQGQGIGKALLKDAVLRTLAAAQIAGIRGLMVHALSPEAKAFYEGFGFIPSPQDPLLLVLKVDDAIASLA